MFLSILQDFATQQGDIITIRDRLQIIELLVRQKMSSENKRYWGSKIAKRYDETIDLWPNSYILFMMRDGRDIASSRRGSGSFNQSLEHVAKGYVAQVSKFKKLAAEFDSQAMFVSYESLVTEPKVTLEKLCSSIDLSWSENVLNHQKEDLSIFKDSTGHLSADQLKQPINPNSIGRWSSELSKEDVNTFESIAGAVLEEFGYLTS